MCPYVPYVFRQSSLCWKQIFALMTLRCVLPTVRCLVIPTKGRDPSTPRFKPNLPALRRRVAFGDDKGGDIRDDNHVVRRLQKTKGFDVCFISPCALKFTSIISPTTSPSKPARFGSKRPGTPRQPNPKGRRPARSHSMLTTCRACQIRRIGVRKCYPHRC